MNYRLKYYNTNSKLKYIKYTTRCLLIEYGKAHMRLAISENPFSTSFYSQGNGSINWLSDYEQLGNDILFITYLYIIISLV